MKSLILYCYYETDKTKINLDFFCRKGIFDSDKYYYIFLINNTKCSVKIPSFSNIKIIYRKENQDDLSTYKYCIETHGLEYFLDYDTFYFINSSCIGPFMPTITTRNWIDSMNDFLEDYSMIGPIIEIPPDNLGYKAHGLDDSKNIPFIHSYMFGVNKNGFNLMINVLLYNTNISKLHIVLNIERALTSSILLGGGKVKSLLSRFITYDISNEIHWDSYKWNNPAKPTCYEVPNNYFGIDVNPFEIIFVKNIRDANESRGKPMSGISDTLYNQIENYRMWL